MDQEQQKLSYQIDKHRQKQHETYLKNRDKMIKQARDRYYTNKEQILEKHKEYREQNKDEVNRKAREYYATHKEQIATYYQKVKDIKKEQYLNNREKLLAKVTCDICNKLVASCNLKLHQKSIACQNMKNKND